MRPAVSSSDRLLRSLFVRETLANSVGGVVATTYLLLTNRLPAHASRPGTVAVTALFFLGALAVFLPPAWWLAARFARPRIVWFDGEDPPSNRERADALRMAAFAGLFALPFWALAGLGTAVGALVASDGPRRAVTSFAVVMLGAIVASALAYLLVERELRPLIARALEGVAPHQPATLGIMARLMVVWGLGSAVPFIGIVLTPLIRQSGSDIPVLVPVVMLSIAGMAASAALSIAVARSIAEPMRAMRAALARVQAGDNTATLEVDDGGEIGLVQSGFNEMVAGLRERQRIEDLFGRHVGVEVARRALSADVHLGGEERFASVYFVDPIGSTRLTQALAPAEVVSLLNQFFEVIATAAGAEGGWINKFEGDAALCVFGVPAPQPDHALRALRSATALDQALRRLRTTQPLIDAAIGISSGVVIAGNVGAERRFEYTVIGPAVNEAARLTEAAKLRPERILASQASVDAAGGAVASWTSVGTEVLRGFTEPVGVFSPTTP
jgi:adenylate cyclase